MQCLAAGDGGVAELQVQQQGHDAAGGAVNHVQLVLRQHFLQLVESGGEVGGGNLPVQPVQAVQEEQGRFLQKMLTVLPEGQFVHIGLCLAGIGLAHKVQRGEHGPLCGISRGGAEAQQANRLAVVVLHQAGEQLFGPLVGGGHVELIEVGQGDPALIGYPAAAGHVVKESLGRRRNAHRESLPVQQVAAGERVDRLRQGLQVHHGIAAAVVLVVGIGALLQQQGSGGGNGASGGRWGRGKSRLTAEQQQGRVALRIPAVGVGAFLQQPFHVLGGDRSAFPYFLPAELQQSRVGGVRGFLRNKRGGFGTLCRQRLRRPFRPGEGGKADNRQQAADDGE